MVDWYSKSGQLLLISRSEIVYDMISSTVTKLQYKDDSMGQMRMFQVILCTICSIPILCLVPISNVKFHLGLIPILWIEFQLLVKIATWSKVFDCVSVAVEKPFSGHETFDAHRSSGVDTSRANTNFST